MSGGLRRFIGMARPGSEADLQPKVPAGYVSTRQAAEMLGLNVRTARSVMHSARVKSVRVREVHSKYWLRRSVACLAKRRGRAVQLKDIPAGLCPAVEAMMILGVTRQGLMMREYKGLLKAQKIKCVVNGMVRELSFYERSKVRGLAMALENSQRRAVQARKAIGARLTRTFTRAKGSKKILHRLRRSWDVVNCS